MTGGRIRHVLVVEGDALIGIVSDRDVLVRAVLEDGGDLKIPAMPVSGAMTPSPIVCQPDTHVSEMVQTMIAEKIDALPVVDEGRVVGLVTTTDLLQLLGSARESNAPPPFDYEIERR
jgi:CBS domain-containing protein